MAQHLPNYKRTNYEIISDISGKALIIRDIGPWDQFFTVTNDVVNVVKDLVTMGKLPPGRRLLYFDSEKNLDEIVIKDGKFIGFAPGPLLVNHE